MATEKVQSWNRQRETLPALRCPASWPKLVAWLFDKAARLPFLTRSARLHSGLFVSVVWRISCWKGLQTLWLLFPSFQSILWELKISCWRFQKCKCRTGKMMSTARWRMRRKCFDSRKIWDFQNQKLRKIFDASAKHILGQSRTYEINLRKSKSLWSQAKMQDRTLPNF